MTGRRSVVAIGLVAALVALVATASIAALARALGIDFEVQDGEIIPVSGVAFVTGVFSAVGVLMAAACDRWSAHPAQMFVRTGGALTALSLAPPILAADGAATAATLVALHLVAAAVMIPAMARALCSAEAATSRRRPRPNSVRWSHGGGQD